MTSFDLEARTDHYADVETDSPLAIWEAMAVPTATTIPWQKLWESTKSALANVFSRTK